MKAEMCIENVNCPECGGMMYYVVPSNPVKERAMYACFFKDCKLFNVKFRLPLVELERVDNAEEKVEKEA